ncbi:Alanine--tRNA ligase [Symbiodinium microadriaticum]|uniref:Alanine--tRNA ligase n=1 Tax=Symbiodinium microadriaticum TaxID=2951 RepID=A0A1Q9C9R7_SYMMI|nr:Alanine--tRNA ligase [Symbiodinium microadriaticum]
MDLQLSSGYRSDQAVSAECTVGTVCVYYLDMPKRFKLSSPVLADLQCQVAAGFPKLTEGCFTSTLSIRLLWRHKTGESHICDDAALSKAWCAAGCDRGGELSLQVCQNSDQISTADVADRTCQRCGQEFASRNQLMRHVFSAGHYADEDQAAQAETDDAPLDVHPNSETRNGSEAWDMYYKDLPDFEQVKKLMQTTLPYCVRLANPKSPLAQLCLQRLQSEARLLRALNLTEQEGLDGFALEGPGKTCWNFLEACQDSGALARQEAASMLPVLLLQVEQHHIVADLCAAPGGKTLQLLDMMNTGRPPGGVPCGLLVANDDNWARCTTAVRRVQQHPNSAPLLWLCGDARDFPTLHDHSDGRVRGARKIRFDRVLCDVPCSGDGRLRRAPGSWPRWHARYMLQMHYVQSAILKRGLTVLKPQGRLLYSTCSMSPVENEAVVAAALEKLGSGQVRLLPLETWSHAPGLTEWRVPAPDFNESHRSYGHPEEVEPELWCRNGGGLASTMFPPADAQVRSALSLCVRIHPTHGDFGGFFCALFEKVAAGPATRPTSCAHPRVDGEQSAEPRGTKHGKRSESDATPNPIPPLLTVAASSRLSWFMDWFGLLSDASQAEARGVSRFPAELIRTDPSLQDGLVLGSASLCRLVLKHARPRILAAGIPLLAASETSMTEHDANDHVDLADSACNVLADCATRQLERLPWPAFLTLLQGGSVTPQLETSATGVLLLVLDTDTVPDERVQCQQISVPGRLTSGHFLVTTLTNSKRHALLRVLGVLTQAAFPEDPMASFPAERKPELCRVPSLRLRHSLRQRHHQPPHRLVDPCLVATSPQMRKMKVSSHPDQYQCTACMRALPKAVAQTEQAAHYYSFKSQLPAFLMHLLPGCVSLQSFAPAPPSVVPAWRGSAVHVQAGRHGTWDAALRAPVVTASLLIAGACRRVPAHLRYPSVRLRAVQVENGGQTKVMNDREILSTLQRCYGWSPRDMGAGGNCLFLSMALQVRAEDVKDVASRSAAWEAALGDNLADRWEDMGPRERASLLRRMAILDESEFIAELAAARARGEPLSTDVEWRTRELFTDMAEEFISSNKTELAADIPGWNREALYSRVREVVSTFSLDQICEYVLLHADEYLQTTGREGNWAGSSEMAALSSVLQRPVQAYGNNWDAAVTIEQTCELQALKLAPQAKLRSLKPCFSMEERQRPSCARCPIAWTFMASCGAARVEPLKAPAKDTARRAPSGRRCSWHAVLARLVAASAGHFEEQERPSISSSPWRVAAVLQKSASWTGVGHHGLLQSCSTAREWKACLALLYEVRLKRLEASLVQSNIALNAFGIESPISTWPVALSLLESPTLLKPGIVSFNSMASASERQCHWEGVFSILELARTAGAELDPFSQSGMANALRRAGLWVGSLSLLQQAARRGIRQHLITISSAITATEKSGIWQQALWTWIQMQINGIRSDIVSFCAVISACSHQWATALLCRKHGGTSVVACNAALSACDRASCWERASSLLFGAPTLRIQPTTISHNALLAACEKVQRWRMSMGILVLLQSQGIRATMVSLNSFIFSCERSQRWDWALQMLGAMQWSTCQQDLIGYNSAISAQEKSGCWTWACWLFASISSKRWAPDVISFGAAVSATDLAGRWANALQLTTSISHTIAQRIAPNVLICTAAMHACQASTCWQTVLTLMAFMQNCAVRQNCVTLHAALSAVDKARPRDSALYLGQELASSATGLLSRRMQMRSRGKISGPMESQACAYFMAQLCNVWGPGAACIATCCKPRASAAARLKFCCVLRAGRTSADSFYRVQGAMASNHGYLSSIGLQPVTNVTSILTSPEEKEFGRNGSSAAKPKTGGKGPGSGEFTTAQEVRDTFVNFFKSKQHDFIASSPVVPHNDPTLLFINAGMNQFKPIFVGQVDPSHPFAKLKRAANSQKCIRAGGKHNDLEDVGKDVYHHTFFEMLGNWSFGNYFKEEAITWAWELLTEVYHLDPSRLYATYYGGDPKQPSVPSDEEAKKIWLRYLPAERILPFNMKDNFWEMGDTGPCGPCSEIHYDRIGGRDAASLVNMDDPDVLEIWNLVFMQFERKEGGSLIELPAKSVDTGMGLERVTSVLLDVRSNYDTDLFMHIFKAIKEKTATSKNYTGKVGEEDKDHVDMAYRVIADHIRTLTIALTDGATPSNEGRGYVLRRILRRAVRFGREILDAPPGFFHQLVDSVLETLGDAFPTLRQNPEDVRAIIREEEAQFGRTLDRGIKQFKTFAKKGSITGEDAFLLFTTYGFPVDLTQLMGEELKVEVDMPGFEKKMEQFRDESRKRKTARTTKDMELKANETDKLIKGMSLKPTDDILKYDWNTEGDGSEHKAKIQAIYNGEDFVKTCNSGSDVVGLVLDRTPLYAEQGGQTFDKASITCGSVEFSVDNTQKYAGYVLHVGQVESKGDLKVGDEVSVKVDYTRRSLVAKNHTATHILNFALRQILGEKVDQKGSLVTEDKLRFDFSHNKPVEPEELKKIEEICNQMVQKACVVHYRDVALDTAKAISGLRAVFGETYPDPVRVVSVGPKIDDLLTDKKTPWGLQNSVEFCGGTHVANSKEIYKFVLLQEEGIAKGIRRIVAVTGPQAAVEATLKAKSLSSDLDGFKGMSPGAELDKCIGDLRRRVTEDKEVSLLMKSDIMTELETLAKGSLKAGKAETKKFEGKAKEDGEKLGKEAAAASGETFVGVVQAGAGCDDAKVLTPAMEAAIKQCPSKAIMLMSNMGGKLAILAVVPKALAGKLSAKIWSGKVLDAIGGKGGGKDDRAQGQGDASKLDQALSTAKACAEVQADKQREEQVSQDEVKLEQADGDEWKILPYFEATCYAEARGDAIRVFQTHGGGHYQMLS